MRIVLVLPMAGMAGCASNTGVVSGGQGSYSLAKQAATGFPGLGNLKAEAVSEGNQYCLAQGQDFALTNATETQPPYILGNYPRAEIEFRCVPRQANARDERVRADKDKAGREMMVEFQAYIDCILKQINRYGPSPESAEVAARATMAACPSMRWTQAAHHWNRMVAGWGYAQTEAFVDKHKREILDDVIKIIIDARSRPRSKPAPPPAIRRPSPPGWSI